MSTPTTPALIRFTIHNAAPTALHIEHTHPVPTTLTRPTPSQRTSPSFSALYLDVLAIITAEHHAECLAAMHDTPCIACRSPTTDLLKMPMSALHLSTPVIVVQIYPVCGAKTCEAAVRARLLQMQKKGVDEGVEAQKAIYGCMKCEECGTEGAKRCAGCGEVGYCGKACQARGWKAHRRVCRRKEVKTEVDGVGRLPYEVI